MDNEINHLLPTKKEENRLVKAIREKVRGPEPEQVRIKKLLYRERGNSPFCSDSTFLALGKLIADVLQGVQQNVIQRLSEELVKELGTEYRDAVEWFHTYQDMDPLLIRWGGVMVAFDKNNLPPIAKHMLLMLNKVRKVPAEVELWLRNNPERFEELFRPHYHEQAFLVWIENHVYIFDSSLWPADVNKYVAAWRNFYTYQEWK